MAATGRLYSMSFSGLASGTVVQDLLALYAGASKILAIQSITLGQATATTVGNLRVRLRYLPPTVTAGTGGAAGTIKPYTPGDTAATATGRVGDITTQASSATAVDLWDDQWNVVNGFLWVPPVPSRPPLIGLSGAFTLSLDTPPATSMLMNGTVVFEELP